MSSYNDQGPTFGYHGWEWDSFDLVVYSPFNEKNKCRSTVENEKGYSIPVDKDNINILTNKKCQKKYGS
jgi:hypothetical protein